MSFNTGCVCLCLGFNNNFYIGYYINFIYMIKFKKCNFYILNIHL